MLKTKTIAHFIVTNFYGGPEKQIINHALRLCKTNYRIVIITLIERSKPNQFAQIAKSHGIEVVEVPVESPYNPKLILTISSVMRSMGVELLCVHGYRASIIGRLSSWLNKIPQIAISRGWTAETRKIQVFEKIDKTFLRYVNHIVAVSHGQQEKILALGIKPGNVTVIHNAIDVAVTPQGSQPLRQQLGVPSDALIVASAGRLSPEKNYGAMIKAASDVAVHNKSIYFVIFGEGFLRENLEDQIGAAGLKGRFLLPGFRTDLQAILQEIDIFMLPSLTEGLPNVVLEAFATRKPVVATRVGGTPEVVQDGDSGFLTKPDEPELMAHHILTLANDPELRQRMGDAGYGYIQEHFTFTAQTEAYERLYCAILPSNGRA